MFKTFIKQNAVFISLSLILLIVLGLALFFVPKGELHLLLCDRHTPVRDFFYHYYTHVAEWLPYIICIAVLLFGRIGDGVMASACMLLSTLTTQVFKHIVVAPRPLVWFETHFPDIQLPLVDGVKMNYWYSFPSGHTTAFFALAFVAVILISDSLNRSTLATRSPRQTAWLNGCVQTTLFCLAALGGYSRIYLCQHFALDVFGGITVGITISILCYLILSPWKDKNWYNYRLFSKK